MSHGTHCDCMMCSVGKKMGMIEKKEGHKEEEHHDHKEHHDHDSEKGACPHCS